MSEKSIAHYRVLQELGQGGMGEVYLAEDTKLRRRVALKILPQRFATDPKRRKRFVREAVAASVLSHPNVAVVYEAGEAQDGTAFISMEHVAGETLRDILKRRTLSIAECVAIATQIADALDDARHHGIVHRDLKPGNIMLDQRGQVKLLDFGIAKVREPDSDVLSAAGTASLDTEVGTLIGTADYMSPEQAQGRPVDHRSDLFSLGAVLYEMVSGKRPFTGDSGLQTLSRISGTQPERITPTRRDCPAELERIIFRCLEKDPESRYQTARELLLDLQGVTKRRPRPRVARFAAAALLIAVVAAIALWMTRPWEKSAIPPAAMPLQSVAVLPFVNMSAQSENEFIADGLTEEIINALAQLPDLKVVSRTSVFAFKGKNADVREIGRKLDVESVVEGSLRRSGNRLRVTAQLIKAQDGYHLWSDTYDRELTDVFAIQEDIASSIAQALQSRVSPGQKLVSAPTRDIEAYELYLKGRQASNIWRRSSLENSVKYFQQAIRRDPSFASAYGRMAEAYSLMDHAAEGPPADPEAVYASAISAAGRALELDPNSVEAHAALGHVYLHQLRLADAERHLQRALELNPNSASARQWYSILLRIMDRKREALDQILKARELDPLSIQIHYFTMGAFFWAGDLDGSIEAARRGIELAPDYAPFYFEMADSYALKGNLTEAEKLLDQAARLPNPLANPEEARAYILAVANRRVEALSLLEKITREKQHPSSKTMASAYAAIGENEKALQWLKRFLRENPNFGRINIDFGPYPQFESIRADPRYRALRKQVGLPDLPASTVSSWTIPISFAPDPRA